MKIPARDSRFLSQADVPSPIVTAISHVTIEALKSAKGEQDKFVLHFVGGPAKPMVLNLLNRGRLIKAYGDESDNWRGKPVEVYVDPDVEMAGQIVGGIRLRIPKPDPQTATATAAAPPPAAAPKPQPPAAPAAAPKPPPQKPLTPGERLGQVLLCLAQARSEDRVREIVTRAGAYDWPDIMSDDITDAAADRLAELAQPANGASPQATQRTPAPPVVRPALA